MPPETADDTARGAATGLTTERAGDFAKITLIPKRTIQRIARHHHRSVFRSPHAA
jgi:hypothetical protein